MRLSGILHPSTLTRWVTDSNGEGRWYPQYGDSRNIGPYGQDPPANMDDFQDLNDLPPVADPSQQHFQPPQQGSSSGSSGSSSGS